MGFWQDLLDAFRSKPKPPIPMPAPTPTPVPNGLRTPRGWFVMQAVGQQNVTDAKLSSPKYSGLVLRESWRRMNPEPGRYNWDFLDAQFNRCDRLGKKIILSIYTGSEAPDWIEGLKFGPSDRRAPYPWNPAMLSALRSMLIDAGARYGSRTALVGVEIGGPTCPDMSIEMHYTHDVELLPGYSEDAMRNAWVRAGFDYAMAFPQVAVISDGGPAPGGGNAHITTAFWDVMRADYPRQFFASHCALKATTPETALHHRIVLEHRDKGGRVLFEAVGPSLNGTNGEKGANSRFEGPFSASVAIGKRAGMECYKTYQGDEKVLPAWT